MNQPLYSALWLEKLAISMTIGLIVMVAALNIVASLVLLVMEKSRDIAILRTMGAPAGVIRRIFICRDSPSVWWGRVLAPRSVCLSAGSPSVTD